MTNFEIEALLERQSAYFRSGETLPVQFRIAALKKLYSAINTRCQDICDALKADLGKSDFESFMCEIGTTLTEISYMVKHVSKFSKAQKVPSPMSQYPSSSYIQPVPYGNVLIMSPWNYPFLLTVEPLADAIAAGNTVIIKPSAYAPNTSKLVAELVQACFAPQYVAVVTGGRAENSALLEQKFDLVFFTGSQAVGKEVLRHAAEHLTPAVLELGGKSPCIVDETADIPLAARRIVFGKFLNCGQTCVAPDHVYCHEAVRKQFATAVLAEIKRQFGDAPLSNPDYGKIINKKHFDRICSLIDPSKVILGGEADAEACRIAPTVMERVSAEDAVMGQEIFGPILPILTYSDFDTLVMSLKRAPKPLALYLFSSDKKRMQRVSRELSYGGGCINDVIIHLVSNEMGFGGVGESGMGSYHGKAGFDCFSHRKSILHKKTWLDLPMRYQPYQKKNEKMLKNIMK